MSQVAISLSDAQRYLDRYAPFHPEKYRLRVSMLRQYLPVIMHRLGIADDGRIGEVRVTPDSDHRTAYAHFMWHSVHGRLADVRAYDAVALPIATHARRVERAAWRAQKTRAAMKTPRQRRLLIDAIDAWEVAEDALLQIGETGLARHVSDRIERIASTLRHAYRPSAGPPRQARMPRPR